MLTSVRKIANAFAPCFVAAGFEGIAHQRFDLLFTQPVFPFDIGKAYMIGQRHLHDVADMLWLKVISICHVAKFSGASAQCNGRQAK